MFFAERGASEAKSQSQRKPGDGPKPDQAAKVP